MNHCKNCHYPYEENDKYCPKCGQKTDTHRINFHFLMHEIQHGIFHIDSGILYTLKELFIRPGHTIREYLEGKRQKHFKPVLFIMILGTIYTLLGYSIPNILNISPSNQTPADLHNISTIIQYINDIKLWIKKHYALYNLLQIPSMALAFYWLFNKYQRYNYAEWLVVLTFITGQGLAFSILSNLINSITTNYLEQVFYYAKVCLLFWTIIQLFSDKSSKRVFLRSLVAYLLSLFFFAIIWLIILAGIFIPYV